MILDINTKNLLKIAISISNSFEMLKKKHDRIEDIFYKLIQDDGKGVAVKLSELIKCSDMLLDMYNYLPNLKVEVEFPETQGGKAIQALFNGNLDMLSQALGIPKDKLIILLKALQLGIDSLIAFIENTADIDKVGHIKEIKRD